MSSEPHRLEAQERRAPGPDPAPSTVRSAAAAASAAATATATTATAAAEAAVDRLAAAVGAVAPEQHATPADTRAALAPFAGLFAAVVLLVLGSGLLGVLIPVRATLEGFPTPAIGLFGTAYYVGFVLGCARAPHVLRRVGHIRTFAALAAVAAAATLTHALAVNVAAWIALRAAAGFYFAGLYTVIESWLNDRARNETRGRVMAAYMAVNMGAVTGGKALLAAGDPAAVTPFALVCIAVCLSLVPVALTRTLAPSPPRRCGSGSSASTACRRSAWSAAPSSGSPTVRSGPWRPCSPSSASGRATAWPCSWPWPSSPARSASGRSAGCRTAPTAAR